MNNNLKVIAFDADDTLWVNEPYFQDTEQQFCAMLQDYLPQHSISKELFKTEMDNLALYGYGAKGLMLSMIETVCRVTDNKAPLEVIEKTLEIGKALLQKPIELLDGVETTLQQLQGKYRLVMATKGDLLDQERKLKKSGLEKYFHHIEIMSDKKVSDYQKLLKHLDCSADQFLMLGNSLKSDVIPVLELNGYAAHIPYHVTWAHEHYDNAIDHPNFFELKTITGIIQYLNNENSY